MIKIMNNIAKTTHKAMKGAKFAELLVRITCNSKKFIIKHNKIALQG
ncbi:MAG: hypothetical protein OEL56_06375 [Nitrosopumilus sp.]|nr:hypothetical protein [Nitrosopumilus sp.]MDH3516132.1 hypothetical protein [Nitrosopumilus sp.]MDH3564618.1 hypothetical protein [Nitrosopumilus sp.]MDH5417997.1 hypothetical protein [Nitrosopumilus sp.]MDH5555586.1 hypothetical protein [Nitrosopumilus sp.]